MSDAPGFVFVPLRERDVAMLHGWLQRPHVAAWWGTAGTIDETRAQYVDDGAHATRRYVAMLHGAPIGFIQSYVVKGCGGGWWEDETDPGARGIDQFIADPRRLGRGLGRAMIASFVEHLFADPSVTVVQADPRPDNVPAIRCYEAAGFVRIGVVKTPDGDALLMRCARRPQPLMARSTAPDSLTSR